MSRRVEVRVRVENPEELRSQLESLGAPGEESKQREILFECARGQLKLVQSAAGDQLVYREASGSGLASETESMATGVTEPAELEAILSTALGVRDVLDMRRRSYRVDDVGVSLDRVEGLGDYLQLTVAVAPPRTSAEAWNSAVELAERLGLGPSQLISGSYADLLSEPS